MGKRKERRLAAKMAAGRRVKLDLFAELSGDIADTSATDEVGGDIVQDHRGVVPASPSSSGQTQENPLLLLGQYSDDEGEEETSKRPKLDGDGSSSDGLDEEEPTENFDGTEKESNGGKQQLDNQVDTAENLLVTDGKENDSNYATAEANVTDPIKQGSVPEPSGIQVNGDLAGGWKMVVHKESNQYYYWNIVTGETSWEIPAVLAEQTDSGIEGDGLQLDPHLTTESATYAYVTDALGFVGVGHLISKDTGEDISILENKNENGVCGHVGFEANQTLVHHSSSAACMSYVTPSALSDFGSSAQISAVSVGVPMTEGHVLDEGAKDKHYIEPNGSSGPADIHTSRVVQSCESLFQRLEALDRCGNRLENHEWIAKEIQIRLSDCRALSSYGSSLLPFWWYTEAQLKQLETTISKGEASFVVPTEHGDGLEDTQDSSLKEEYSSQNMELESEMENKRDISVTAKSSCHSPSFGTLKLQTEPSSQPLDSKNVETEGFSSAFQHLKDEQEQQFIQDSNRNTVSINLVTEGLHADDDIDMDVEMEVDEDPSSGQTASVDQHNNECPTPAEGNRPLPVFPPLPPDEPSVPPPPDEEWIPPPPPDSEPAPPPPPEEPSLPPVPPPYPDTMLLAPYPNQYNVGYAAPVYEYYPSTADVTGGNYYAHTESSHITGLHPSSYFEPVVTSASHEVVADVNSVEPVVYYDVSSGKIPAPVVSSIESSGYHIESDPFTYATAPVSDHTVSAGFTVESGSNINLLPMVNPVLGTPSTFAKSQVQASFVPSTAQSGGSTSVNVSAADALPVASSKNQTNVVRRKKHTVAVAPSLRSNKKVSSLVDKWKAAKVELHSEEDEEPENAYEVIEKKRQKDIEEWRARQIASGEAQDNANFLPLGGDWRERVKRKKAAMKIEAVQTPTELVDNEKHQPNLVELSKDLPSGWQAYWDDSSKEVYYANSITSETTWTWPTR